MRLAKELGRVDVDGMLDEISPQQFDEWVAYANLEPFDNGWMQTAIIAATVHNMIVTALYANAGKKVRKQDLLTPDDFMPTGKRKPIKKYKRQNMVAYEKMMNRRVEQWR